MYFAYNLATSGFLLELCVDIFTEYSVQLFLKSTTRTLIRNIIDVCSYQVDGDVTLVAHSSMDRLQLVEALLKHWEGLYR